jgi:hypothetical protein
MFNRFAASKLTSTVGAAMLLMTGCNSGNDGHPNISPVVEPPDANPWLAVEGVWTQPGAGKAIAITDTDITLYQYNQTACIRLDNFDLQQGLTDYSLIAHTCRWG